MLRTVKPNTTISHILRWEGIVIDPLGAILAVLVFELILTGINTGHASIPHTLFIFSQTILFGIIIGAASGYLFGLVLRHHLLPDYLHNVATLTLVFAVFTLSDSITEESGLLAVTVMGVWLANMKGFSMEDILDFKESLSIFLISGLFIILAARLDFSQFSTLGIGAFWLFLTIQFIVRPVKVFLSTLGSDLSWQEKTLISWIGPRGIVAAAVSALFAIRLQNIGVTNAELLVPLSFTIIIGTVFLQGSTAKFLADKLGVSEPDDKGFLIVGANIVARTIAKSLNENGYRTRLTDSSWTNIKTARMEGFDIYFGNVVSEHADRHLDLVGLGQILTLSPQKELNALAGLRYRAEFGGNHIFSLSTDKESDAPDNKSRLVINHQASILFGNDVTYSKLASLISHGAKIKQTGLTESFDYQTYLQQYENHTIPLFTIDDKGKLRFFTSNKTLNPENNWTIVALVREFNDEQPEK